MADYSTAAKAASASLDTTNSRLQLTVPATGKYSTSSKLYAAYSTIRTLIGLTAAKIATGNTILGTQGSYTGLGDATAADVLSGKKFSTASLSNETGTLPNKTGTTTATTASLDNSNNRLKMAIPAKGCYDTAATLYTAYSTIRSLIGLTASILAYGKTCLGLTGTYKPTVARIAATAYRGLGDGNIDDSSEEATYTCPAAGICYYNGISVSEDSRKTVTCEIYKNGTLVDSENITSTKSGAVHMTMVGKSFSVASGDVIKIVTAVTYSYITYAKVSHIDATIVTYP